MTSSCPLCQTAARCDQRTHPLLIATLEQTHVILGENQGCPGWCVCVLREHVEHLDLRSIESQQAIFGEVAVVAKAIRAWSASKEQTLVTPTGAAPRINYECLGNVVPHIHWHVIPRHAAIDPDPLKPVWGWSQEQLRGSLTDEHRLSLALALRGHLSHALRSR